MPTFAIRSSKHPKMRSMFPLNDKTHNMGIRQHEKFKVKNAHTDRLTNSLDALKISDEKERKEIHGYAYRTKMSRNCHSSTQPQLELGVTK
jgi:hypothetical protein